MTTTPAPKGADIEQYRPGFEAWARGQYDNLGGEFAGPGDTGWYYWDDETAAAWEGYAEAKRGTSIDPESVPVPTTVNMARMMLALAYNYLKDNASEHLGSSTSTSQGAAPSESAVGERDSALRAEPAV